MKNQKLKTKNVVKFTKVEKTEAMNKLIKKNDEGSGAKVAFLEYVKLCKLVWNEAMAVVIASSNKTINYLCNKREEG